MITQDVYRVKGARRPWTDKGKKRKPVGDNHKKIAELSSSANKAGLSYGTYVALLRELTH